MQRTGSLDNARASSKELGERLKRLDKGLNDLLSREFGCISSAIESHGAGALQVDGYGHVIRHLACIRMAPSTWPDAIYYIRPEGDELVRETPKLCRPAADRDGVSHDRSKGHTMKKLAALAATLTLLAGLTGCSTAEPVTTEVTKTVTATVTSPAATITAPAATITVTSAPTAAPATAKVPPAAATYAGNGTYEVGVDIKPGTYKSGPDNENCYWARLKADGADIIDNDISAGQSIVTIQKSDKFFKSSGCNEWTRR